MAMVVVASMMMMMMVVPVIVVIVPFPRLSRLRHCQGRDRRREADAGHFGQMASGKLCFRQAGFQLLHVVPSGSKQVDHMLIL
jgi:hypothetical protein